MKRELHRGYILRVERSDAGMQVPFDKIYLFPKKDAAMLPRIFKNAMVLPIGMHLARQIEKVYNDKAEIRAFPFKRAKEQRLLNSARRFHPFKDIIDLRDEFLALVPVLFTKFGSKLWKGKRRKGRKKTAIFPAYLVARPNRESTVHLMKKALTARAYFVLDGKEIKPICLMCPRHQYWLQGECSMGDGDCYSHLAQAKPNDLVLGVERAEEYQKLIDEPDILSAPEIVQAMKEEEKRAKAAQ